MFQIYNGRKAFWQWDSGQRLLVLDERCQQVHFQKENDTKALVCPILEESGQRFARVPDALLQSAQRLYAYALVEEDGGFRVLDYRFFNVYPRAKPEDYIYTETEHWTVEQAVADAVADAVASGDFKGDKGDKGDPGEPGGGALPLVYSTTLTEPVTTIDLKQIDGKSFSFSEWRIIVKLPELFTDYVVNAYLHPIGAHKDSKGIAFASLANTDGAKLQILVASNVGEYMYEGTYSLYYSTPNYKNIHRRYFDFPVVSEAIYLTTWDNAKPLPVGTILEVYGR